MVRWGCAPSWWVAGWTSWTRLDAETRQLKRRIAKLVEATGRSVVQVQVHGVGPLVAARILGEVGDVRRFGDRHKFAAANGTAPCTSWPSPKPAATIPAAPIWHASNARARPAAKPCGV